MMDNNTPKSTYHYAIGGLQIEYPYQLYPSQITIMAKIITALKRSQSCLVESPTGSGKTLALLCSSLTFQRHEQECLNKIAEEQQRHADAAYLEAQNKALRPNSIGSSEMPDGLHDPDNDDFKIPSKALVKENSSHGNGVDVCDLENVESSVACSDSDLPVPKKIVPGKAPRIYFGTRTHKQIAQIVRELKKSNFKNVRLAVLASRDQTCVHEVVSVARDKNEACREALNSETGSGCQFYRTLKKKFDHPKPLRTIMRNDGKEIFDIEDLVAAGKKHGFCPYFATTHTLPTDADLIICPYNYLIDPKIRSSMSLNLKGQIVIIDEAHNIEDSCRDAASFQFSESELFDAEQNCMQLIHIGADVARVRLLRQAILSVLSWCREEVMSDRFRQVKHELQQELWKGAEIVAIMKRLGLDPKSVELLKKAYSEISSSVEEEKEEDNEGSEEGPRRVPPKPLARTMSTVEKLLYALEFIYMTDFKYVNDYRMCLQRELNYGNNAYSRRSEGSDGWLSARSANSDPYSITLNFWCMNPAVAFESIGLLSRSIILASGTLAPMGTFEAELGHLFPHQVEASHVLGPDSFFVGTIGVGPNGEALRAVYGSTESAKFQDELGLLILRICQCIPGGILCFMPSYKVLTNASVRWRETGLLDTLNQHKNFYTEPRRTDELTEVLLNFHDDVRRSQHDGRGGLILAVCRGKISEGIDFADDFARAVITVGIPFPNAMETVVKLKKEYNEALAKKYRDKKLLSGSQGYRALNQALGRCIRHAKDWGALILIDERFGSSPSHCAGLSKWIREKVVHFDSCDLLGEKLLQFVTRHENDPKVELPLPAAVARASPTKTGRMFIEDFFVSPEPSQVTIHRSRNSGLRATGLASANTRPGVTLLSNVSEMKRSPLASVCTTPVLSACNRETSRFVEFKESFVRKEQSDASAKLSRQASSGSVVVLDEVTISSDDEDVVDLGSDDDDFIEGSFAAKSSTRSAYVTSKQSQATHALSSAPTSANATFGLAIGNSFSASSPANAVERKRSGAEATRGDDKDGNEFANKRNRTSHTLDKFVLNGGKLDFDERRKTTAIAKHCLVGFRCLACGTTLCSDYSEMKRLKSSKLANIAKTQKTCKCAKAPHQEPFVVLAVPMNAFGNNIKRLEKSINGTGPLNCRYDEHANLFYEVMVCSKCASEKSGLSAAPVAYRLLQPHKVTDLSAQQKSFLTLRVIVGAGMQFCDAILSDAHVPLFA